MKKRRWLKIGLAALAVLALLLIVTRRDRGPEVASRPLEEWVQDLLVTADPDRRAAARVRRGTTRHQRPPVAATRGAPH